MAKKKPDSDINVTAHQILQAATGEPAAVHDAQSTKKAAKPEKNPAAVALGRLGGLKGGKARAEKLSTKKRAEIARNAASARWHKP